MKMSGTRAMSQTGVGRLSGPAVRAPFWYTVIVGGFLLLQGASTLLFRLFPALDAAFPLLLGTTRMVPVHSLLHITTGALALAVIRWGNLGGKRSFGAAGRGARGPVWFALGFGTFYTLLGLSGLLVGDVLGLGLQPFDHPFHLVAGVPGLIAAGLAFFPQRRGRSK